MAAWVVAKFEATLEKAVILAVLMGVVASMGGIAGSQTLTLVIRGIVSDYYAIKALAKVLAKLLRDIHRTVATSGTANCDSQIASISFFEFTDPRIQEADEP